MSVGFIIFEIIDKDSPKNQGINTGAERIGHGLIVGYSLKNQGINTNK